MLHSGRDAGIRRFGWMSHTGSKPSTETASPAHKMGVVERILRSSQSAPPNTESAGIVSRAEVRIEHNPIQTIVRAGKEATTNGFEIICTRYHNGVVGWVVEIGDEFEPEFDDLHEGVRIEILALARLLQQFGPQLKRPRADTLNDSRHANMKELRLSAAEGEWRPSCS
jgi:hypothetical protein